MVIFLVAMTTATLILFLDVVFVHCVCFQRNLEKRFNMK